MMNDTPAARTHPMPETAAKMTDAERAQAVKTLTRAKQLIEGGWIKGRFSRAGEGYCISGALLKAQPGLRLDRDPAYKLLQKAAAKISRRRRPVDFLCDWNDDPRRTREDAVRAFDLAIKFAGKE